MLSVPMKDTSFSCVGLDWVGPLPASDSGAKYIINAVDYLTKWPDTKAIPNKEAFTFLDFFTGYILARHGCPDEVITDKGSDSLGAFDDALQAWGIDHCLTSPNHPAANGLVEHLNGTCMKALRKCMAEDDECMRNWDKFLPRVLLVYRATE